MKYLYGLTAFVVGLGLGPQLLAALLSLVDFRGRWAGHYGRVFGNLLSWSLVTAAVAWLAKDYRWAFWLGLAVYVPYYGLTYLGLKLVYRRGLRIINQPHGPEPD